MDRLNSKRIIIPTVVGLALVLGGGTALAVADDGGRSDGVVSRTSADGTSTGAGSSVASSGDRDRAGKAALQAAGGGRVTSVEHDGDPTDAAYEVDVVRTDGSRVEVQLDEGFKVISSDEEAPSDADRSRAAKAATAAVGGGTATDVESDDDHGAGGYEVEVRTASGAEWDVVLDRTFHVVSKQQD